MGWVREDFPDHEGIVVGFVRRDGCRPGLDLYRELSFSTDPDARARPAERIAAGCRCGWRSPRWSPERPATYGPFSLLACVEDEERAHQLWERHLVLDAGGDRVRRISKVAVLPSTLAALLRNHSALEGATDEERRQLVAELEGAMTALGSSGSRLRETVSALLANERVLGGATDDERRKLVADLEAALATGTRLT